MENKDDMCQTLTNCRTAVAFGSSEAGTDRQTHNSAVLKYHKTTVTASGRTASQSCVDGRADVHQPFVSRNSTLRCRTQRCKRNTKPGTMMTELVFMKCLLLVDMDNPECFSDLDSVTLLAISFCYCFLAFTPAVGFQYGKVPC